MFERDDLAGMLPDQLCALIEDNARELRRRDAARLLLAAAWADAHDADEKPSRPRFGPLIERWISLGSDGTPQVAEFCVGEFATLNGLSYSSGKRLLARALDLRHRLPKLWDGVRVGDVHAWKAIKVAEATQEIDKDAAWEVDHAISGFIETLPWPRFQDVLNAAILEADADRLKDREERAKVERRVWCSDYDHGLKTIVARANSGDATWFMATVNRIADILKAQGSLELIGERRARAVGILAQPAVALQLLSAHRLDPDPHDTHEPTDLNASVPPPVAPEDLSEPEAFEWPEESDATDDTQLKSPDPIPFVVGDEPDDDVPPEVESDHTSLQTVVPPAFGGLDGKDLRPRAVLYFHIAETTVRDGQGLVRPEHGGAQSLDQLMDWLAETGCAVQIRPVVVPADTEPVDGYEIPTRIREAVRLREIADVFPYGRSTSGSMDLDHTMSYVPMDEGGPPGQTAVDNLGPLTRSPHRAATHGQWKKRQPAPGVYVWRSPNGWIYVVTNQGTMDLGNNDYSHAVWAAAAPSEHVPAA